MMEGSCFFFFLFIHYSHATYQIMALSAVRAVAARCKLPSALRPPDRGAQLSQLTSHTLEIRCPPLFRAHITEYILKPEAFKNIHNEHSIATGWGQDE